MSQALEMILSPDTPESKDLKNHNFLEKNCNNYKYIIQFIY